MQQRWADSEHACMHACMQLTGLFLFLLLLLNCNECCELHPIFFPFFAYQLLSSCTRWTDWNPIYVPIYLSISLPVAGCYRLHKCNKQLNSWSGPAQVIIVNLRTSQSCKCKSFYYNLNCCCCCRNAQKGPTSTAKIFFYWARWLVAS